MLKTEENVLASQGVNHQVLAIKARHLNTDNLQLRQTLRELEGQLQALRVVNRELLSKSPQSLHLIIDQLSKQNLALESAMMRQMKVNEQLNCDLLMKSQLLAQNQTQIRQISANYQSKIYQLRVNLQTKQVAFSNLEDKILTERDELYNMPTRANITYFNEMNQLKLLLQRHVIENAELQLILIAKNNQIETINRKLALCESTLKQQQDWKQYQQSLMQSSPDKTKATEQANTRLNLEQELTRYDTKYKYITWHNNRKTDPNAIIYELKMFITKLMRDRTLQSSKTHSALKEAAKKEGELQTLRIAYQSLEKDLFQAKVETQFYRTHFKQLARVTTERKLKFYMEQCPQSLPPLGSIRKKVVAYWKECSLPAMPQLLAPREHRKPRLVRSNSCPQHLSYRDLHPSHKKNTTQRDQAIFSFINMDHDMHSVLGCTFQIQAEDRIIQGRERQLFDGEISMIGKSIRPRFRSMASPFNRPFSKKESLLEQL